MLKLYTLVFIWGPTFLGFSLGWLLWHLDDWTGPAVMGPLGLALTILTYRWGLRRIKTLEGEDKLYFGGGMIAGAAVGLALFAMLAVRILP